MASNDESVPVATWRDYVPVEEKKAADAKAAPVKKES